METIKSDTVYSNISRLLCKHRFSVNTMYLLSESLARYSRATPRRNVGEQGVFVRPTKSYGRLCVRNALRFVRVYTQLRLRIDEPYENRVHWSARFTFRIFGSHDPFAKKTFLQQKKIA